MAKKKKAKSKTKRAASKKAANSLVTGFLTDFRWFLTRENPTKGKKRLWAWPPANELPATSFGSVADVVNLLGTAVTTSTPPPPDASATFIATVAARVAAYPWPTSPDYKDKNGKPFGFAASTVNMYEIGQVAELMLQAINSGGDGTGGGGPHWPPIK